MSQEDVSQEEVCSLSTQSSEASSWFDDPELQELLEAETIPPSSPQSLNVPESRRQSPKLSRSQTLILPLDQSDNGEQLQRSD